MFLDRDGTLNVDRQYVRTPDDVELVRGAADGARMLEEEGFTLVVVSNQSGIARGYFTEAQAQAVDDRVAELLASSGAHIERSYRCPHLPGAPLALYATACDCRKPLPGMILQAARELNLDLACSWAIGDRARDVAAGIAAGCKAVAVAPSPPRDEPEDFSAAMPEYIARDLRDAARYVIAHATCP
ncbi:MAG: HAD family hydrolase [Candidatus Eremiobacteraeota bacterium]|nr:HAD family hydrolase [Candidatus Eremiobacteraeota bacterium]